VIDFHHAKPKEAVMLVKEAMTRDVEVIHPDATLQEAAEKMRTLDIGPLPVCEGDRVVGMLTDRDIAIRAVAEGYDPWTDKVRDAMTTEVVYCFDDQTVEQAAQLMKDKQIRRLIVLDGNRRLVGILSLGDIAVESGDKNLTGAALEQVSKPAGQ
jgi:CBS domain-containing protein